MGKKPHPDNAHSSPRQVNPTLASTSPCLLRLGITDTTYLSYVCIFLINQAPKTVKLFGSYPTHSARASHTLNLDYFDGFGQFSAFRNSEPIATVFYGESVIAGQRWRLLPSTASSPPPCPSSMERHPAALLLLPSSFPTSFHWLIIFCQLREKWIITYIVLTNYWILSLNIF